MRLVVSANLLALVCLSFIGCAEDNSGTGGAPNVYTYNASNYKGIESELVQATFYCASSAECPSNVGLLYSNVDGGSYSPRISQCTGFLIAPDVIATNSHCIPERLKSEGGECEGQIAIRFSEIPNSKKTVYSCKKVLRFSKLGLFDPDYAFLQVEATDREPLKIHRDGLKDNQPVSIAKVTPLSSGGGTLEVDSCKVGLTTFLNPTSTNSWARTAVGLNCKGVHGNSGSPVLNQNGEVLGILQSELQDAYRQTIERSLKQFQLTSPEQLPQHIVFTNLSCVPDAKTGVAVNEEKCAEGERVGLQDCIELENDKSLANSARIFNSWKAELPKLFVYKYVTDEKTLLTTAFPVCVKRKADFADYDNYVQLDGVYGFRTEKVELTYPASIKVGPKFSLDDEYRLKPEMDFFETERSNAKIVIEKDGSNWTGHRAIADSLLASRFDFLRVKFPVQLADCTQEQLQAKEASEVLLADSKTISEAEYVERNKKKQTKRVCER